MWHKYTHGTQNSHWSLWKDFPCWNIRYVGCETRMVAWLAGFTAFQTTKVIIHSTSRSNRRISCLEPQKSPFQPAYITPAFQNSSSPLRDQLPPLTLGSPKARLSYLTMTPGLSFLCPTPLNFPIPLHGVTRFELDPDVKTLARNRQPMNNSISFQCLFPFPCFACPGLWVQLWTGLAGKLISEPMLTGEQSDLSSTITYVQTSVVLSPHPFHFLVKKSTPTFLRKSSISVRLSPTAVPDWALIGLSQEAERVIDVAGRHPCGTWVWNQIKGRQYMKST